MLVRTIINLLPIQEKNRKDSAPFMGNLSQGTLDAMSMTGPYAHILYKYTHLHLRFTTYQIQSTYWYVACVEVKIKECKRNLKECHTDTGTMRWQCYSTCCTTINLGSHINSDYCLPCLVTFGRLYFIHNVMVL